MEFWINIHECQPYPRHSDLFLSCQTHKLMAGTKFSDYLGLKHYKKAKKIKKIIHLNLANWPQSFSSYHRISNTGNSGYQIKKHVLGM